MFARARYIAVSNGLWAYERFRPCRTIGGTIAGIDVGSQANRDFSVIMP
jgi:hypothetical protein